MTSDRIVRSVLRLRSVRVVSVVTSEVAREAARRHGAVGAVAAAMARAATAGLLLATLTKDEERVTLQVLGDGPLGALTVDATAGGRVRVFVKRPGLAAPALAGAHVPLGRIIGRNGILSVVRDLGLKESVSGQTALIDGEIDTDVEGYLVGSEQIESAIGCEALLAQDLDIGVSGGVLLQTLPGSDDVPWIAAVRARLRSGLLAQILAAPEPPTAEHLARAVVGDDAADLHTLDVRPVTFFCPCTRDRAAATLRLLGAQELSSMITDDGGATVTCEFCRQDYRFAAADLEVLAR